LFPNSIHDIAKAKPAIYPNPATDKLFLSLPGADGFTATLTDVTGKVLQHLVAEGSQTEIQISAYPQGIYYILLSDTKGNQWAEKITRL
jgi:hypothetical protein